MDKIKAAVVGTGNIAIQHIESYIANPNAELYALCNTNEARLREVGLRYGVSRLYTDERRMLAELPELDAVSICTGNSTHAECATAALEAGKNVLCEKPMATSAADAEKMRQAADRAGKLLMIGFVRRFGTGCEILKDMIDKGKFGEIYYAKATFLRRNGSPGGWFGSKARSGGGPLIDLGVHIIDLTRYLMGNPRPVSVYGATFSKLGDRPELKDAKSYRALGSAGKPVFDVEDMASAMIRYDNGAVVHIDTSFSLNTKEDKDSIHLFGTKAGACMNPELEIYSSESGYMTDMSFASPTATGFEERFQREIDHFVDCVINGTPCRAPAEDGVVLMKILDAIYKSAETGHEIIL